ncbi:MAG: DUF5664 domain-containing protein [Candidatus Methanomethylicaceae archaeon]
MKLAEYIRTHNINPTKLAIALGVTRQAINYWINGARKPRPYHANLIVRITGGQVTPEDLGLRPEQLKPPKPQVGPPQAGTKVQKGALKYDKGKLRWDLLPWEQVESVVKVFEFGAKKYGEGNWQNGILISRLYAATLRHLTAFWALEDTDPETKLPHLAHCIANLLMMAWTLHNKPKYDDRYKHKQIKDIA